LPGGDPCHIALAGQQTSHPGNTGRPGGAAGPATVEYRGSDAARPSDALTRLTGAAAATDGAGSLAFLSPPRGTGELGRFGPYPVLSELGRGGMGVVLRAEDVRLGRRVALKVMGPALAAIPMARERFLREARAVAGLAHDNVVPVFHAGEEGGLPYLIMPELRGETLEARLRREVRLTPDAVARLGREVAEGLRHAHERGLVHRDVKPANIWMEEGTGRAKVLDFGLVRVTEDTGELTRPGTLLGTPSYMAPEQIEPRTPVDHRCDLFALGCVLYQACTGQTPFQGAGVTDTFWAVLHHQPPPPRSLNPAVPAWLSELIVGLLTKDPQRRPVSAASVAATLRAVPPPPPPPVPAPGRRWRRRWLVAAVPPLLLLAFLALRPAPPAGQRRGTLVIESGDAAVTFRGCRTRVADPCTKREFELRACEGEIEVKELPDGVPFFTREFVLRERGTVIVAVRLDGSKGRP
jgi:hypothetical protein